MNERAIAALEQAMANAAAALDYETASRLRDELHALRNGASIEANLAGFTRQQPGSMGLGTSRQRVSPPEGWVRPKKPDSMTQGRSRRNGHA